MHFIPQWLRTAPIARKRQPRRGWQTGSGAESLELRQLMSATNELVAAPEPAAVALAAPVTTVWELTFDNESVYTATFIQKGKKLSVETSVDGLGYVTLKGKLDPDNPEQYLLKGKEKLDSGKVTIMASVAFESNTALTGEIEASFKKEVVLGVSFTGELTEAAPTPLAARVVSNWTLLVDNDDEAIATFWLVPEKKLKMEVSFPDGGISFKMKGKADPANPAQYQLKGNFKVPGQVKYAVTFQLAYLSDTEILGTYENLHKQSGESLSGTFTGEIVPV